jgi:hypothetical protein
MRQILRPASAWSRISFPRPGKNNDGYFRMARDAGPPHDCKGKLRGEETSLRKCIRPLMEISFPAMMSCARVCPYKSVGR